MLGKATAKGFPSYPRWNAVFEALNIPGQGSLSPLRPSTKVAFLCFPPSLHWFQGRAPAESRWHALYT